MLGQRYLYDGKAILDLNERQEESCKRIIEEQNKADSCLLYTSDAADD